MSLNYNSDEQTYLFDFGEFFERFDEDIVPLCHSDAQIKKYLKQAIMPYINNDWGEFVERVKEETE